MKKRFVYAVAAMLMMSSASFGQALNGFAYGDVDAPRGYGQHSTACISDGWSVGRRSLIFLLN